MTTMQSTIYAFNSTCGVTPLSPGARHPDVDTNTDAPTWRASTSKSGWLGTVGLVHLGPDKPRDAWYLSDTTPGCVLLLGDGGDPHSAQAHGFALLDLRPLSGAHAIVKTPGMQAGVATGPRPVYPRPDDAERIVGRALADAWHRWTRVAVVGPDWALDVLAVMPGVLDARAWVEHSGGDVVGFGRRWRCGAQRSPYEVGWRVSGQAATEVSPARGDHVSLAFLATLTPQANAGGSASRTYAKRRHAVARGDGVWRVRCDLGLVDVCCSDGRVCGEPLAQWPSSADPWVAERVGDGDALADEAGAT